MRKLNRSSWWALTLVLLAAASLPAAAEQASARFTVSAFVPQRVSLQAIDQPALLAVSSEDITRGYKDLSARFEVRHNTANGYLLSLSPRLGLASRVEVLGLDSPIELRRPRSQGLPQPAERAGAPGPDVPLRAGGHHYEPGSYALRSTSRLHRVEKTRQNVNVTTMVSL